MIKIEGERSVSFCDGHPRRDFLHVGALTALGLSLPAVLQRQARAAAPKKEDKNCILLMLVGAPSQLDTWDPKPAAPHEVRGPFQAIPTNVPGIQVTEIFPRMARHADKLALVRSVYYTGVAIHDA